MTAREHYIAHALLWKMKFPGMYGSKMTYAIHAMANLKNVNRRYRVTSHMYQKIREEVAEQLSVDNSGEGNPFYGKKHADETLLKFKEYHNRPDVKLRKSESVKGDKNPAKDPKVKLLMSDAQKDRMKRQKLLGQGSYSESFKKKQSAHHSGSGNGRAKQYKFVDENDNEYSINGSFKKFCAEHVINTQWARNFASHKTTELFNGWKVFDLSDNGTRTVIHKDHEQKFPKPDELQEFLDNGWAIGCKPRKPKIQLTPDQVAASHEKRKATLAKNREHGIFLKSKGRKRNPESVKKSTETRMARMSRPEYVNPAKGKKKDPAVIAKILATKRANGGFKGLPGKLNPNYGKPRSEETKAKIRATKLANKLSKLSTQEKTK